METVYGVFWWKKCGGLGFEWMHLMKKLDSVKTEENDMCGRLSQNLGWVVG